MAYFIKFVCVLWVVVLSSPQAITQESFENSPSKSFGKASVNFLSNDVYFGRAYDTAISYTTALLGYYHKTGLFVNASASYGSSVSYHRFDLYTLTGGYEFLSPDQKLSGSVTVDKYFYNKGSKSIKSAVKTSLYANVDYDFGWLFFDASAGANFANKTDFALTPGVGHNFYTGDSKFSVSPSFYMYAGSQHFYSGFRNRARRPRPGQPPALQDNSTFKILDYEFSIPSSYETGKFTFSFTPYYAIPVNPLVYPNAPMLSEKLKNRLYAEADIAVKF